jgi:hypothetical protein
MPKLNAGCLNLFRWRCLPWPRRRFTAGEAL